MGLIEKFTEIKARYVDERLNYLGAPAKPQSFYSGKVDLFFATTIIPLAVFMAYDGFQKNDIIIGISGLFGAVAGTLRAARSVDSYIVGKTIRNEPSVLANIFYSPLALTPLRVYTLNQVSDSLEKKLTAARVAQIKERVIEVHGYKALGTNQDFADERTLLYLDDLVNHRTHLRHAMYVVLGILGGAKILTGVGSGEPVSVGQWAMRAASYVFSMGYGLAQIDAFVQKRRLIEPKRVVFDVIDQKVKSWPTRKISNWLLKRQVANFEAVLDGRQPWMRRAIKRFLGALRLTPILKWYEKNDYALTPHTRAKLDASDVMSRYQSLRALTQGQLQGYVPLTQLSLRAAWKEFVHAEQDTVSDLQTNFRRWQDRIDAENKLKAHFEVCLDRADSLLVHHRIHPTFVEKPIYYHVPRMALKI